MTEIADRPAVADPIAGPNRGLTKFLDPLPVPPVPRPPRWGQDMITIPLAAKRQRLHSQLPPSTLRTYAGHFPGPKIDVRSGKQLWISWSNEIEGKFPLAAVRGPVADGPTSRPGRELDRPGYSIVDGVADLPGGDRELPLILTDRTLNTDPATGRLTGQLLYMFPYVPNGPMIPFSGPFTLVNGVIWPHLDGSARWYRFRLLNAANSPFFTLNLVDENNVPQNDAVRLIGTDGGLLPARAPLPPGA